jgi:3-isopropylmalate dehydrogenase
VNQVLLAGFRTADIMQDGCTLVGTTEMGDKIVEALKKTLVFQGFKIKVNRY